MKGKNTPTGGVTEAREMAGIIDIGFSIPSKRLTDDIYFRSTKTHLNGERTVADFDEDSITLACEAGEGVLELRKRDKIYQLLFVSTTPVYNEKSHSSVIAPALDLNEEIASDDLIGSLRSSLSGIRIAAESINRMGGEGLVLSGECRSSAPGSPEEAIYGDAGSAVLIGSDDDGIAVIEDYYSITSNFISSWRLTGNKWTISAETKYSMEYGFQKIATEGINSFLKKKNLKIEDISAMVLIAPDGRSQNAVFKSTCIRYGMDEAEELFRKIGYCGTSAPILLLASILDRVKEGERVLLCAWGDGFEIILLRINGKGQKIKDNLLQQIDKKVPFHDYSEFLKVKGFLGEESLKPFTSIPVLMREEDALLRLHGTKCKKCGSIQYPPRQICWHCSAKDEMEIVKLKKSGNIYTCTRDFVYTSPFPPTGMAVIDLDGGGRFYCQMVDSDKNNASIGIGVKLTLRRLHEGGDFVHYFWKAKIKR